MKVLAARRGSPLHPGAACGYRTWEVLTRNFWEKLGGRAALILVQRSVLIPSFLQLA